MSHPLDWLYITQHTPHLYQHALQYTCELDILPYTSQLRHYICIIYISPTGLKTAVQDAPDKSIIILEDIDAIFDANRNSKVQRTALTFSGMLVCLQNIKICSLHSCATSICQISKLIFIFPRPLSSVHILPLRPFLRLRWSVECARRRRQPLGPNFRDDNQSQGAIGSRTDPEGAC